MESESAPPGIHGIRIQPIRNPWNPNPGISDRIRAPGDADESSAIAGVYKEAG